MFTAKAFPAPHSPWMYDTVSDRWDIRRVTGPCPGSELGDVLVYVPSLKKVLYYFSGTREVWLYDPQANAWAKVAAKGPVPTFGIDAVACLDTKRERIYIGGGYYPLAPGSSAFWAFDLKTKTWMDLQPKGKVCGGCNRYGPNHAAMNYDAAADAVLLLYYRLPAAGTPDGEFNPGAEALGVYAYDPTTNAWSERLSALPKDFAGACVNAFYSTGTAPGCVHKVL